MKDLLNLTENKVDIDAIQTIVCKFYKISKNEMLSPRRSRYLVRPRQTAIYLAKMLTSKSLPEIGRSFSKELSTMPYSKSVLGGVYPDFSNLPAITCHSKFPMKVLIGLVVLKLRCLNP